MYKLFNPNSDYQGEFYEYFYDGQAKGVANIIEVDRMDWRDILLQLGYVEYEESESVPSNTPEVAETDNIVTFVTDNPVEEVPKKRGRGRPRKNP